MTFGIRNNYDYENAAGERFYNFDDRPYYFKINYLFKISSIFSQILVFLIGILIIVYKKNLIDYQSPLGIFLLFLATFPINMIIIFVIVQKINKSDCWKNR